MKGHHFCRVQFSETMKDFKDRGLILTGKFCRDRQGNHEAFVYDDRITVFHSMNACCVYAAKTAYLESMPTKRKQTRR
jgi:hypothetical protein